MRIPLSMINTDTHTLRHGKWRKDIAFVVINQLGKA